MMKCVTRDDAKLQAVRVGKTRHDRASRHHLRPHKPHNIEHDGATKIALPEGLASHVTCRRSLLKDAHEAAMRGAQVRIPRGTAQIAEEARLKGSLLGNPNYDIRIEVPRPRARSWRSGLSMKISAQPNLHRRAFLSSAWHGGKARA
jgi:hypothetical protein